MDKCLKSKKIMTCLVLAAIATLYGILIMLIRSGSLFYIFWFILGFLLIALAFAIRGRLWQKLGRPLKAIIISVFVLCLACFLVVEGFILSGFRCAPPDNLDYLIVLGAQVRKDGPSYILKRRLDKAADYLEANPDTICIVSGGQGSNEPFPEAVGMAEYLTGRRGISSNRIVQEPVSANTVQNITNSMQFIEAGSSVGIVTNNFHVFRSLKTAERLGLNDVYGIGARSRALFLPNNMCREFFAVIKFLLVR